QSPEQRRRSFFYFREPLPYDRMPPEVAASFSDEYSTDPQTRARHGRLVALKQSLADDPELAPRVHNYHADWEVSTGEITGLEAWGELVYRHLLGELQAEIAAAAIQPPQTWEDQERAALAEFIEHRRRDFTGRQQLLDDLTNLARSETPPGAVFAVASGVTWGACLTGEPGSGKSAIFAELVARLSADDSVLLLTNAAGATPRGSQVEAMLERFIEELAAALGIANPLPEQVTPDDVEATFSSLLGRVAVKRRVVVLLDALNQFDPTPRAQHLTWLRPKLWPGNARLIATGLVGVPTEALSQWAGIEKLEVPPLTVTDDDTDDVTAIAQAVWLRYHRQVNPAVLRVLKDKHLPDGSFAAGNPLWLTLALEQINLLDADDFARAEREFPGSPAERLRAMLIDTAERMPPTVAELYDLLLAQTERIFGVAPTRAFAAVIAVSRFGWRETDLLALIPVAARVLCPDEPVPKLDDLRLAALRRSFRAHLARRGALVQLDFFHAQMRLAVAQRLLTDLELTRTLHRTIADHLESLPPGDPLRDSELMFHLIAGDDPARAARVYADLPDPSPAFVAATQELAKHIVLGAKHHPNVNADWVADLVSQSGLARPQVANVANRFLFDLHDALANTADLISRQTLLNSAQSVLNQLTASDSANFVWQHDLLASFDKLGGLAKAQGNLHEAQRLFGEALRTAKRLNESDPPNVAWQYDLSVSFQKVGDLATAQGNLHEAQRFFGESLRIRQRLAESDPANTEWQRDLPASFRKLGDLATARGNLRKAQRLFSQDFRIAQRLAESDPANAAWQRDLAVSLNKLGDLAKAQGNLLKALRLFGKSFRIAKRLNESDPANASWQRDLSVSLEKLGTLATVQGNLPKAQRLFGKSCRITQRLAESDPANAEWQCDLAFSHYNLAVFARESGDEEGFTAELRECFLVLDSMKQRGLHFDPQMAQVYNQLAGMFGG
ncbi:MAG: tetratricopeptide repeat protein, partial [Candidatus Saccharimonas sp.]|nr:tetratricopeptide repeat protein [Planctomycetaceae bacterium]